MNHTPTVSQVFKLRYLFPWNLPCVDPIARKMAIPCGLFYGKGQSTTIDGILSAMQIGPPDRQFISYRLQ